MIADESGSDLGFCTLSRLFQFSSVEFPKNSAKAKQQLLL